MRKRIICIVLSCLCCAPLLADSAHITGLAGVTIDAQTGDTLPFVQILFLGSQIGTTSDIEGHFSLSNTEGYVTVQALMVGYKPTVINLRSGHFQDNYTLRMEPDVYGLHEIVVTPTPKWREKYSRKDNPAVDLIKNVIAHKQDNRLESADRYKVEEYEKLIMALDQFDFDFQKSKFWRNFDFIEHYVDTAQFNNNPVLTISIRETLSDRYHQRKPHQERQVVKAKRVQGIEKLLARNGLDGNIDAMFTRVDIFDDNIEVMLNRFVSPLSSALAVSFYHYYIQDTLMVDDTQCIDLAFVPVNSESFGFTGHLYIVCDSTYALKKYSINVPPHINMNFVSDLSIEQSFQQLENGMWAPEEINTYSRFYIFKKMRQLYAHNRRVFDKYDFTEEIPDSLFVGMKDKSVMLDSAMTYSKQEWTHIRPVPLTQKESIMDSLVKELRGVKKFQGIVRMVDVFAAEHIPTSKDFADSKFDFGPIWNFISYNKVEGVRLRVGGMTTANLSNHCFLSSYLAFGCSDLRVKHNATFIYSFNKKEYHPYESLRHALYLSSQYDIEVPGQAYTLFDRDNIIMSIPTGSVPTAMQYVYTARLRYEKEWENRLAIDISAQYQNNEAAGSLRYERILADGTTEPVKMFHDVNLTAELRFTPGQPMHKNRMGKESVFNLAKDAPVISLRHKIGVFDFERLYNYTEISAEKRFWLSSFGHIDAKIQTGIVWNKVPFPKLYIPNSNQSLFMTPNTFNMMKPMEFAMDSYVAWYITYYLKGWIFNRIPGWNKLKLREVISFSGIYGGLSAKNNPLIAGEGLYVLPDGCSPMGKVPYMELTAGVENIFKFLRIDYVRRLNYNDGLSGWKKNGIRFTFRFTL
ncbi:MAG: DUF5686 family protein [Paludibacteraceae bacterium]